MTPPNILFLLSDEHSFRYLSYLTHAEGGEPVRTPTLDSLAARGTFFENAYCQMPLCTPSRICMLTGRDQEKCGAWSNNAVLPPEIPTLPGHLAEHGGYETALVGKMHFGGSRQFNGFRLRPYGDFATKNAGHQPDPLEAWEGGPGGMMRRIRLAGVTTIPESFLQEEIVARESVALLREHRHRTPGQPWLLCASFSRPHFPWTAPRRHFERYWPQGVTRPRLGRTADTDLHPMVVEHRRRFDTEHVADEELLRVRAAYMACVDYLDEVLGDFLATLERDGLLENTIVVYTTDHGEMAGENGMFYKNTWHEAAAHVPFIIQTPEHRRGALAPSRLRTPVSLGDLFPTLCGLVGVEPPDGLDGHDLSGAIRSSASECERGPVISQSVPGWRMLREGRFKYVAFRDMDAPEVLIDLETDPGEQRNLAAGPAHATVLAGLRAKAMAGFDFETVAPHAEQHRREMRERFPMRITGRTPNQLLLPDGRLVEGDAALYLPEALVTEHAWEAFDDWPP
ncbi:MAG: sulfatase-like hydrolase/transferase [Chloroflexi bacterium]|nr:sulfatase-like hydrolase/transferase [Chloroflexota bacterium]